MKAIVKTEKGVGNISLEERTVPEIGRGEVLIRIKAAAVCGTDLHIVHDQFPYWPPVILGHEFAGIIESVGSEVTDWKPGDRVVGEPHTLSCGNCFYCRTGHIQNCESKRSPGWGIDGCFTEFMRYPEPKLLHRLPPEISFESGSLVEPIANVVTDIVERGLLSAGDSVAIIGPGPIGLMAGIVARVSGASRVILIGTKMDEPMRIPVARKLGVFDEIFIADEYDCVPLIKELTSGLGVDMVVEASGSQGGIAMGVSVLRKYGRFIGIGLPGRDVVEFPYKMAMLKVLQVICNMSTSYTSWERSISILKQNENIFAQLISHVFDLADWEKGFDLLERKAAMKVVFKPGL
ncbi:alcohol dehydrogenase catalytic domain-containing protein [uncultured Sphaerochaeta sp.]|uniref:zinc-dependent alcohol dehydrogenase n=1 Tax=uncultured Sphaerochaeta sp. TaxID=886478 RepID=UPI002A0A16EF|nr:alcohol dehydrogenase catalytic domain-containing protein [uncultured Sphaerochaeta sp.]